jgi:subtilisin family serine protease
MTIVTGVWLVAVVTGAHALAWLAKEALTDLELGLPGWLAPVAAWVPVLPAVIPALLLARFARLDFARVAGRGWAVGLLLGALLGTVRAVPPTYREVYLVVLALVATALAGVPRRPSIDPPAVWAGILLLLPWLWAGALGGAVETLCAAGAAAAIGRLAARRLPELAMIGGGVANRWARTALAGLVLGVGIVGLVAGVGEPGIDLLALVAAPVVGFLRRPGLVGAAVLGPLAFIDPVETTLLLGLVDVAFWALLAALGTAVIALLLATARAATGGATWKIGPPPAVALSVVVCAAAGAVYFGLGQPGLYGERVFVVLKEQADLSGLDTIRDRPTRVRETYARLVATADRSQASLRRALRAKGLHFRPYYLVNGVEVDGGEVVRAWLAGRSDVDRVLLNPRLRPVPAPAGVLHGGDPAPDTPPWNLTAIGADQVWQRLGVTGKGIVVGASDSGVDGAHPALRDSFRGGDDSWLDPFGAGPAPRDHQGHGTHTLATAVGAKVGVAPGAQWMGCVNLPRNLGNPADYLTCLQFMLAPYPHGGDPLHDGRPERAAQVLTNSWGCPELEGCDRDALRQAVAALTAAGLYVVVAAGNSGPSCGSVADAPATYPDSMTVGAVDRTGALAAFSSRGPAPGGVAKPDLVAPGVGVLSALPGGGYGYLDGTSMATPHVAGVVALMWSANPRLVGDVPRTTAILRSTATPLPEPACGTAVGEVNALAAVRAAQALATA